MLNWVLLFKTGFPGLCLVAGRCLRLSNKNSSAKKNHMSELTKGLNVNVGYFNHNDGGTTQEEQFIMLPMKYGVHRVHNGDTQVDPGYVMGYSSIGAILVHLGQQSSSG